MRLNAPSHRPRTHEGGPAVFLSPEAQLERSVMACLLWEDSFYEDGVKIAERIKTLAAGCPADFVARLAVKAREEGRLRHAPLWLARELARHPEKPKMAETLARVIQRADEPAEFLALYWREGRRPLSKQVKLGLARALQKFDAYQLAKYNRDGAVKLRDVLFLSHARPRDEAQAAAWRQLADRTLPSPDTWEVALSGGADKKETFTRLLGEGKLGYLALLRNLRNMVEAGVEESLIREALLRGAAGARVLPFRFIAAARAVPRLEATLDQALKLALAGRPKLAGRTLVLVDVSGSMDAALSGRSELCRLDAAGALAVLFAEMSEEARVFSFSNGLVEVPPRQGLALVDAIRHSQAHGGTLLGEAVARLKKEAADRLIVLTDAQSAARVPSPAGRGYMINVASYAHGVGYGPWTHIDGFSEAVVQYVQALESQNENGG
jgi:hypothetical protein